MTSMLDETWRARLSTICLCSSMVALGIALGVNLFSAKLVATLDLQTALFTGQGGDVAALEAFYHQLMYASLSVFAIGSVGVVALERMVMCDA